MKTKITLVEITTRTLVLDDPAQVLPEYHSAHHEEYVRGVKELMNAAKVEPHISHTIEIGPVS